MCTVCYRWRNCIGHSRNYLNCTLPSECMNYQNIVCPGIRYHHSTVPQPYLIQFVRGNPSQRCMSVLFRNFPNWFVYSSSSLCHSYTQFGRCKCFHRNIPSIYQGYSQYEWEMICRSPKHTHRNSNRGRWLASSANRHLHYKNSIHNPPRSCKNHHRLFWQHTGMGIC